MKLLFYREREKKTKRDLSRQRPRHQHGSGKKNVDESNRVTGYYRLFASLRGLNGDVQRSTTESHCLIWQIGLFAWDTHFIGFPSPLSLSF